MRFQELSDFFKENLSTLFSHIVLPNIFFSTEDIEDFEADPEAFVKADLEENDNETRRRTCL